MYKQYKDKEERTFRCLLYAYGKVTDKIRRLNEQLHENLDKEFFIYDSVPLDKDALKSRYKRKDI